MDHLFSKEFTNSNYFAKADGLTQKPVGFEMFDKGLPATIMK